MAEIKFIHMVRGRTPRPIKISRIPGQSVPFPTILQPYKISSFPAILYATSRDLEWSSHLNEERERERHIVMVDTNSMKRQKKKKRKMDGFTNPEIVLLQFLQQHIIKFNNRS